MQADLLESIPHAKTHHTFSCNTQAHHSPLWAFADIIDNSEAWATQCSINMREGAMLEIVDNGEGMSEYTLVCGLHRVHKGLYYGQALWNGSHDGCPSVGDECTCFSYHLNPDITRAPICRPL